MGMNTFFTVLLGSGIGAAIVTVFFELWASSRRSEIDHLQQQLERVYGPLYYFTSQNCAIFELCEKYVDAHRKEPAISD